MSADFFGGSFWCLEHSGTKFFPYHFLVWVYFRATYLTQISDTLFLACWFPGVISHSFPRSLFSCHCLSLSLSLSLLCPLSLSSLPPPPSLSLSRCNYNWWSQLSVSLKENSKLKLIIMRVDRKVHMLMSYLLLTFFLPMWSKYGNTDGRSVWTVRGTKLKKPHSMRASFSADLCIHINLVNI